MIDRRELLTMGGLIGALVPGTMGSEVAAEGVGAGAGQLSDRYAPDLLNALGAIRLTIANAYAVPPEVSSVRNRQVEFLKGQGKFPDFVDVAVDIWTGIYDWHVHTQQPLVLGRDATGRYTLMLGFTALVLRPDAALSFISIPYDR